MTIIKDKSRIIKNWNRVNLQKKDKAIIENCDHVFEDYNHYVFGGGLAATIKVCTKCHLAKEPNNEP